MPTPHQPHPHRRSRRPGRLGRLLLAALLLAAPLFPAAASGDVYASYYYYAYDQLYRSSSGADAAYLECVRRATEWTGACRERSDTWMGDRGCEWLGGTWAIGCVVLEAARKLAEGVPLPSYPTLGGGGGGGGGSLTPPEPI